MAPISTIFGPNESRRCQLKFEKISGRRTNVRDDENFEKLSRKVRKSLPEVRFRTKNKIETATYRDPEFVVLSVSGASVAEQASTTAH